GIPNRWLSESRHVGQRFVHCRNRGRAISLGLGLRGCFAGCTTQSSAEGSEMGQIDRSRRRGGCAGAPRRELCSASLVTGPLIDGFVLLLGILGALRGGFRVFFGINLRLLNLQRSAGKWCIVADSTHPTRLFILLRHALCVTPRHAGSPQLGDR